jgi:hypothetical protein
MLLLLLTLAPAADLQAYSWGEYTWYLNPANNHYYALTFLTGTWTGAEAEALAMGGHLASITSLAEETWIDNKFSTLTTYWIGGTDAALEGRWVWTTGELWSYANWAWGEPNNAFPEHYLVKNITWYGINTNQWNDEQDGGYTGPHQGIIEVGTVPLPPGAWLLGTGLLVLGLPSLRRGRKE